MYVFSPPPPRSYRRQETQTGRPAGGVRAVLMIPQRNIGELPFFFTGALTLSHNTTSAFGRDVTDCPWRRITEGKQCPSLLVWRAHTHTLGTRCLSHWRLEQKPH